MDTITLILSIIRAAIVPIATIIASITAIYGINTWSREHIGRKKIDLAEETLMLFYEARDAIGAMRNGLAGAKEGSSRKKEEPETEEETRWRNQAYVLFERYDKRREVFDRLLALRFRFMALFGNEHEQMFLGWRGILNELFSAAQMLGNEYWPSRGNYQQMSEEAATKRRKEMHDLERIFWRMGEGGDKISPRLDKLIEDLEAICRPVIAENTVRLNWLLLPIRNPFRKNK